jgi:hypothetical protein
LSIGTQVLEGCGLLEQVRDVLLGASTSVLKFNAPAADEVGRHSTVLGHCVNHGLRNGTWRTLQKAAIAVGGICQQQIPSNQWLVQRWLADKKRHLARQKSLISGRGPVNRALAKPDEALDLKHSKIKQEWSHEYQPPPSQPLTGSLAATSPVECPVPAGDYCGCAGKARLAHYP